MTNGGGSIILERVSRQARELLILVLVDCNVVDNFDNDGIGNGGGGHVVHFDENLKRLWRWE